MVRDWKVLSFVTCRAQVLYKVISEPPLGFTDVEEATLGSADTIDLIDCYVGEPLSDVKCLSGPLDGCNVDVEGQGLVLVPLLFVIYINDLDENVQGMI
eukprot:g47539.t1